MDWADTCTQARFELDAFEPLSSLLDSTSTLALQLQAASSSEFEAPSPSPAHILHDDAKADSFKAVPCNLSALNIDSDRYPGAPSEPDDPDALQVAVVASQPQGFNSKGEDMQTKKKKKKRTSKAKSNYAQAQLQKNLECVAQLNRQCQKSFQGKTDALSFVCESGKGGCTSRLFLFLLRSVYTCS